MAWIGAHFAIGMSCSGAIAGGICQLRGRGWKSVPVAMLAGGLWAVAPDLPHTIRQDLPDTVFASWFGAKAATMWLHEQGNWFFFHKWLDQRYGGDWTLPRLGLWGMASLIVVYNTMVYALFRANDIKAHSLARLEYRLYARTKAHREVSGALAAAQPSATDDQPLQMESAQDARARRKHDRLDAGQPIAGMAVDPVNHTLRPLQDASLINMSDGGMAISTSTTVEPGATLHVRPAGDTRDTSLINAVVLEQIPQDSGYKLRCRSLGSPTPTQVFKAA